MGNEIPNGATSTTFRGLFVQFCCPGCDLRFLAEPEKYISKAADEKRVVALSLFDPVAHIAVKDPVGTEDYRGIRYPFSSAESLAKFREMPELYAEAPDMDSLTCPVMQTKIANYKDASGYADFEGVRYYFCCAGCDAKFLSDPAKYALLVKKSVRKVGAPNNEGLSPKPGSRIMPTCAGCAGEARLLSADGSLANRWTLSMRYINERRHTASRQRISIDYALSPRLSVGLERSGSDDSTGPKKTNGIFNTLRFSDGDTPILPRASWFITTEGKHHPSLVLGLTSDRLSTPHGQAFFLTAAHTIKGVPITPFVSVKTNSFDGKTVFPFGANLQVAPRFTLQAINDGDYTHLLLTHLGQRQTMSIMLAKSKYLGFAWSVGF